MGVCCGLVGSAGLLFVFCFGVCLILGFCAFGGCLSWICVGLLFTCLWVTWLVTCCEGVWLYCCEASLWWFVGFGLFLYCCLVVMLVLWFVVYGWCFVAVCLRVFGLLFA